MSNYNGVININSTIGELKYKILGYLLYTNSSISLNILGGDKPHIGSIIISYPRASLKYKSQTSVTTSTHNICGHKDDELGRPIAEMFAREFNLITVVVIGIHIDNATNDEIDMILKSTNHMANEMLNKLKIVQKNN